MRQSLIAVGAVVLVMLLPLLMMFNASYAEPEVPVETPTITVTRTDNSGPGSLTQGRRVHIPTVLPTVRVTIKVPGPTKTETVRVTAAPRIIERTERVPVPGPTRTITNEQTETVTIGPSETRTVTVPGETVTIEGGTRTVTRQATPVDGTIDDNDKGPINIGNGDTTPAEVGLGLLTLLALGGIGVGLLWAGYVLGHKAMEGEEKDFMRALLDTAKRRH